MKCFGIGSINDFLEDRIVYRNLAPVADGLSSFDELSIKLEEISSSIPRKTDLDYAKVIVELIKQAYAIHHRAPENIKTLVYIGDTMMNDGGAFQNMIKVSGWDGYCLICSEKNEEKQLPQSSQNDFSIYQGNRWSCIYEFESILNEKNVHFDESMVLLMDMDKTMVGARGRNDQVIDSVRMEAALMTLKDVLHLNQTDKEFRILYKIYNEPKYHHFTKDNQDYLVYICILLRAGVVDPDLILQKANHESYQLADFLEEVNQNKEKMSAELLKMHEEFESYYIAGDPTPFKAFRRAEFVATSSKFDDDATKNVDDALNSTIVITNEVYSFAKMALSKSVLTFGLSDKPDEASLPTNEQKKSGMKALHQLQTLIVGEERSE